MDKRRRATLKKHEKQRERGRIMRRRSAARAAAALKKEQIDRFDPLDIYRLGEIIDSTNTEGCTITSYTDINKHNIVIKKITYPVTTISSVARAFTEIYRRIRAESGNIVLTKICSGDAYEPIGYVVLETQGGGALCSYSAEKYKIGMQIGKEDQGGENIDKLYLEKTDDSLIIKRLIDGDQDYSRSDDPVDIGKNYKNIYLEIRATNKAGQLGVGPLMVYGKIVTDSRLRPVGYIVMERIRGKYLTREQVRENAGEIRRLLTVLYDNRMTHGDLHNRNIMKGFTESSGATRIWIIDYGFAEFTSRAVPQDSRDYRIAILPKKIYARARYEAYENV